MKLLLENWRHFLKEGVDLAKAQQLIDNDDFLRDEVQLKAAANNMIEGGNYVLFYKELDHIKERHADPHAPGSLFTTDLKQAIKSTLENNQPNQFANAQNKPVKAPEIGGRVKWISVDAGVNVGAEGINQTSPEEAAKMKDHRMPDPPDRFKGEDWTPEVVKIAAGERKPTQKINLITGYYGELGEGKKLITLITAFPGTGDVPSNRRDFAAQGLYFVLPENSPLLDQPEEPEMEMGTGDGETKEIM